MPTARATPHHTPPHEHTHTQSRWEAAAAVEHHTRHAGRESPRDHAPHTAHCTSTCSQHTHQTQTQLATQAGRPPRLRAPSACGEPPPLPPPPPLRPGLWRVLPLLCTLLLACSLPLLAAHANFTDGVSLLDDPLNPDATFTNSSSSDGEDSFDTSDPYFVPPEPTFNDTHYNASAIEYVIPVAARNGIWSYQCCNDCLPECSGRVVHRVCLNRTTLEKLPAFSCSLIPAIPVSSFWDWAAANCSLNNCPTWETPLTYNTSEQACGRALAFPNSRCTRNGTVLPSYRCFPQERPQPLLMNHSETCSPYEPSLGMLKFEQHTSNGQFEARQFFDVATLAGVLYLVGGLTASSVAAQDAVVDVWRSADLGVSWDRVDVHPTGFTTVQDHTVEVIGSSLIVIGGMQRGVPSINVWRSDDGGQHWSITGHLPMGRAQHDSVPFLNGIVIAGGWSLGSVTSDVFFTTDGAHFYLQTLAAPWSKRTYPRLAVSYDTLILCGGWLENGKAARDIWRSTDAVQWTQVTAQTPFAPRVGYVFFSQYRELVLMGGISQTGSTYFTDQWSSGDQGLTWNQRQAHASTRPDGSVEVSSSFSARAWPGFVKVSDQIVVVGGEYQGSKLSDVYVATNAQKQAVIGGDQTGDGHAGDDPLGIASDGVLSSQTRIVLIVCGIAAALTCMAAVALVMQSRRRAKRKELDLAQAEGVQMQHARAASVAAISPRAARGARGEPAEVSLSIEPGQVRVHVSPEDDAPAPGSHGAAAALAAAVGPAVPANHSRRSGSQRHPRQPGEPTPPVVGRQRSNPGGRSRTPSNGAQKSALAAHAAAASSSGGAGGSRPPSRHSSLKSAIQGGDAETPRRTSSSAAAAAAAADDSSLRSDHELLLSPNHVRQHSGSTTGGSTAEGVPAASAGLPPPSPFLPALYPPFMLSVPQLASGAGVGAGAGAGAAAAAAASSAAAAAPFFVDPSHVAWMQAQMMQYQASLLAAVSAQQAHFQMQQQQQQSTPPPPVVRYPNAPPSPLPAGAAALPAPAPFVAEEWIRSVPQLSAQQSQRVFVPQPLAPFSLPLTMAPSPSPPPPPPLMPLPFAVPSAFAIPPPAAASAAAASASASASSLDAQELQPGAEPASAPAFAPAAAAPSSPAAAAAASGALTVSDAGAAGSHAHPPLECASRVQPLFSRPSALHSIQEGATE